MNSCKKFKAGTADFLPNNRQELTHANTKIEFTAGLLILEERRVRSFNEERT